MTYLVKLTSTDWVAPAHVTGVHADVENCSVIVFLRTGKRVIIPNTTDADQIAELFNGEFPSDHG